MKNLLRKIATLGMAVLTILNLAAPVYASTSSLPDETSPRSLTIFKYDTINEDATAGTGIATEVNTSIHTPLTNVIFDVYYYASLDEDVHRSISLSDAEAWIEANADALIVSLLTDENGKAVWNASEAGSSADGVYLVAERSNRAIQISGTADPFFISLPYTDVEGDGWIYDVAVQPKNNLKPGPAVDKDVLEVGNDHAGVNLYEPFTWHIRGEIPSDLYYTDIVNGTVVEFYAGEYKITDSLAAVYDYIGNVSLSIYENNKCVAVLPEAAYSVSGSAQAGKAGGELTVSLTPLGMKNIMSYVEDPENAELVISFETKLNNSAEAGIEYDNDATLEYTNSTAYSYESVSVPDDKTPEAHTGGFRIEKIETDKEDTKLEGAEFHIAATESDAKNKKWLTDGNGEVITLTTDKNGLASYVGLAYDSGAKEPSGGTYYWLVETEAPKGYLLDEAPARFTVNAVTYAKDTKPYQIENELDNRKKPNMPLTGNDSYNGWLWAVGTGFIVCAGIFGICGIRSARKRTG